MSTASWAYTGRLVTPQDSCYCSTVSYSSVHTLPAAVRPQAHTFKYPKASYRRSRTSGTRTSTYGVEPCLWQERAGLAWSAVPVDSQDTTSAARVHQPLHPLRLYGCGPHVCRNPGQNTRSTASCMHVSRLLQGQPLPGSQLIDPLLTEKAPPDAVHPQAHAYEHLRAPF